MTTSYRSVVLAEHTIATASMFRSAFDAAGVEFVIDCAPLTRPAIVDPEMWEKVVLDLLSNAFKFTLEGTVELRLREDALTRISGAGLWSNSFGGHDRAGGSFTTAQAQEKGFSSPLLTHHASVPMGIGRRQRERVRMAG